VEYSRIDDMGLVEYSTLDDMQKWICRSGYAEVDMQKWIWDLWNTLQVAEYSTSIIY
jgi:hypothetical protein